MKVFSRVAGIVVVAAIFIFFATQQSGSHPASHPRTRAAAHAVEAFVPTEPPINSNAAGATATIARVIDGDTIELATGQRVRYIGMDTPETVDPDKPVGCFGEEAHQFNEQLVAGKVVRLVKDVSKTDKYGRLLRFVYVGDTFVNRLLVQQGFARVLTIAPDSEYSVEFRADVQAAQAAGRGLWSACVGK